MPKKPIKPVYREMAKTVASLVRDGRHVSRETLNKPPVDLDVDPHRLSRRKKRKAKRVRRMKLRKLRGWH